MSLIRKLTSHVLILGLMGGLGSVALTSPVGAQTGASSAADPGRYIAPLHPLNGSGVTGFANLSLDSEQPGANLVAQVSARGAEPSRIHAMHIHGSLDGKDAECPTTSADTNHDRLISVFEGAPFYGPIKVSFTTPPTIFGPPSRTDLFAPFAGVPNSANFPLADSLGRLFYSQTIPFDQNNQYAVQALASLQPLDQQHIVIHGGFAPESVDTPGGDPNKIVYDGLLPIACGPIIQSHQGSGSSVTISNTGPGSTNRVNISSNSHTNITNSNQVNASNQNNQSASSGQANSNGNTFGGSSSSGSANNQIQSIFNAMLWGR